MLKLHSPKLAAKASENRPLAPKGKDLLCNHQFSWFQGPENSHGSAETRSHWKSENHLKSGDQTINFCPSKLWIFRESTKNGSSMIKNLPSTPQKSSIYPTKKNGSWHDFSEKSKSVFSPSVRLVPCAGSRTLLGLGPDILAPVSQESRWLL